MKRIFLGSLSAAALTAGVGMATAQTDSGAASGMGAMSMGDMSQITCAQFLALPEDDRETHATALTAAAPDSIGEEGADRGEVTGAMPPMPEQDAAADGNTGMSESGSASSEESSMSGGGTSSGTDMTAGGSGSTSGGTDMPASGSGSTSGGTDMTAGGSGSAGPDGSGGMSGSASQSPTAVALVTICENTEAAAAGGSDSGTTEN